MWRRVLRGGHAFIGLRSGGTKALWGFHGLRACSAPALPAGCITALQAVDFWTKQFEGKGVTEPELSSRYIIAYLLGAKTIESLEQQRLKEFLSREETDQLWQLCTQRLSRMPVQYVIGEWDFRDLTLKMRPPVFIPRPETEELVEVVLTDLQRLCGSGATVLEVGCGSGAISVSLLKSLPQLKAFALDQSQEAVDLTRENALRYGVQDRLQVHNIDVVKDADALLGLCGSVAVLVSNPPYLFSQDMTTLQPEILRFEDHAALDGGKDGLNVIKQILTLAPRILPNQGRVYLEVDPRHPPLIQQWVEGNGKSLQYIETRSDICGRPRFCILQNEAPKPDQD
ncbi:hemK methyltransferase family member 1 [Oryzias latipes]|uniref:peptide chain release factor N(5)-glutamine methyltransferase n=1 Tax=Oryzias latipes TaxID=8090 RepID=H2LFK8_ORYLA|nr:hemK methyltransferase family member 1 [Oryzias latipes]